MPSKTHLRRLSEHIRDAKEILEFAGETPSSKGGNAKSALLEERNSKIKTDFNAMIAQGKIKSVALGKLAKEYGVSVGQIRKILNSKK